MKISFKKKFTLIETVIVMTLISIIYIFSANALNNNLVINPPLFLNTWHNFSKLTIKCESDDFCNILKYCPLKFEEDYITEVNNTNWVVEWKFTDLNKYLSKDENCRDVEIKWYQLHSFAESLQENTWSDSMFIINWILYDKKMKKINWVVDKKSWTQILDWMVYFN